MFVPTPHKSRIAALAVAVAAALAVAGATRAPAHVDIAIAATGTRALVRIGFATVSVAFDSGQDCPKADGCGGAAL